MRIYVFMLFVVCFSLATPCCRPEETPSNTSEPLYQYLMDEGRVIRCSFTLEDYSGHTLLSSNLAATPIAGKEIATKSALVDYLHEQLPGVKVYASSKYVISMIPAPLVTDPTYALNKSIDCDFDGASFQFIDYLGAKLDNAVRVNHRLREYGPHYSPVSYHVSIHTKHMVVRSILLHYLTTGTSGVILWDAVTDDATGKHITDLHINGSMIRQLSSSDSDNLRQFHPRQPHLFVSATNHNRTFAQALAYTKS